MLKSEGKNENLLPPLTKKSEKEDIALKFPFISHLGRRYVVSTKLGSGRWLDIWFVAISFQAKTHEETFSFLREISENTDGPPAIISLMNFILYYIPP